LAIALIIQFRRLKIIFQLKKIIQFGNVNLEIPIGKTSIGKLKLENSKMENSKWKLKTKNWKLKSEIK